MEHHPPGIRVGPTVQQGGVQTIQQSIYLNHNNPCGINFTLGSGKVGTTGINALELIDYLNLILVSESVQDVRKQADVAANIYSYDVTEENFLLYIKLLVDYGRACAAMMADLPPIEGYNYVFSIYDPSGAMIWDSHTPDLLVVKETGGVLSFQELDLVPGCPYGSTVQIYQINERPYFLPYIRISGGTTDSLGKQLLQSQFLNNVYAQAENTLSVGSLLIDNQNTRVYIRKQFGIGVRQIQVMDPSAPTLGTTKRGTGYYVNYLSRFNLNQTDPRTRSLFEFMFVRLGLEQVY